MLHVHLHLRACVGGMCGRREVTRKTLAETRTVRKKKSNTEPTSYFLLKSISSESPALCRRRGYDKSPPRAATSYITCTSFVRSMCSTTTSTGFVGEGEVSFF